MRRRLNRTAPMSPLRIISQGRSDDPRLRRDGAAHQSRSRHSLAVTIHSEQLTVVSRSPVRGLLRMAATAPTAMLATGHELEEALWAS